MLFAAGTSKVDIVIAIVAILLVMRVLSFLNYKERAEIPTQENTIKRIAEHQGAERFESWKLTRAVLTIAGVVIVVLYVVSQVAGK
jgi:Tfp pilus assembly protein PilE